MMKTILMLALCIAASQAHPVFAQSNDENALKKCLGEKMPREDRLAACKIAAEEGQAIAQLMLGLMYANGEGVPENNAEAVKWYKRAAELGNDKAQFNLGYMYFNGMGVPENNTEAVKWFRRAAEQGNAGAQLKLGLMYVIGKGVPEDYVQAFAWYNLSAAHGDENASNSKDLLRKLMTPDQIERAQALSAELFRRIQSANNDE